MKNTSVFFNSSRHGEVWGTDSMADMDVERTWDHLQIFLKVSEKLVGEQTGGINTLWELV